MEYFQNYITGHAVTIWSWTCLVFAKPGKSLYRIEISLDNFNCYFFSLPETNPLHLPGLKPMTGIRSQNLQLMVLTLATLRRKKVKKNNVILDFIYLWHEIKYILLYLPVLYYMERKVYLFLHIPSLCTSPTSPQTQKWCLLLGLPKSSVPGFIQSLLSQVDGIVKILNLYVILLCTHLHHFFPVSIHYMQCITPDMSLGKQSFIACYIIHGRIFNRH